jgi:hypothetical protein
MQNKLRETQYGSFFVLLLLLFCNCFEFQEISYRIDFKNQTLHIEYASPYCSLCTDSSLSVGIPEGKEKEYAKYSKAERKYYSSLILLDAHIQKGDSIFFGQYVKSSIGNIAYHLIGKRVFKSGGKLRCIIDAKIDIDWLSPGTLKPATCGHFKTSHPTSYKIG